MVEQGLACCVRLGSIFKVLKVLHAAQVVMEVVGLRRIATRIQVHLVLGGRATAWSDTLRHSATFHGPWIARSSFAERTFLAQVSILVLQLDLLFNYVVISFPCLRVI